MAASVEPPPISRIASGSSVPGVVMAPRLAITASTPATSTCTPSSFCKRCAISCIGSFCVLTIAAIPTAFSRHVSPASAPEINTGASVSTARISVIRISADADESTSLMPWRMRKNMFPTFVFSCPKISEIVPASDISFMIRSAPSSRLMVKGCSACT